MFDYITANMIKAATREVSRVPKAAYQSLLADLQEAQPAIFDYLYYLDDLPFDGEEEIEFNLDERSYIMFTGLIIWKALTKSRYPLRPVAWSELYNVMNELETFAAKVANEPWAEPEDTGETLKDHPEPELLRYAAKATVPRADNPSYPPLCDDHYTAVFLIFQIILVAMVNSREA